MCTLQCGVSLKLPIDLCVCQKDADRLVVSDRVQPCCLRQSGRVDTRPPVILVVAGCAAGMHAHKGIRRLAG